ncbi:hypothetical protein [Marivita hallyeonensis]|nr:hypothetical protein [Marivita hallyeonensis]
MPVDAFRHGAPDGHLLALKQGGAGTLQDIEGHYRLSSGDS